MTGDVVGLIALAVVAWGGWRYLDRRALPDDMVLDLGVAYRHWCRAQHRAGPTATGNVKVYDGGRNTSSNRAARTTAPSAATPNPGRYAPERNAPTPTTTRTSPARNQPT